MSTWREQLQEASYRGVIFHVRSDEREVGRRLAVHEFPFATDPYVEDLGRAPDKYSFDAYIVGDDVFEQYQTLVDALTQAGSGELVHPIFGAVEVYPTTSIRLRHQARAAGMIQMRLSFIQAGAMPLSTEDEDTGLEDNKADSEQSFLEKWQEATGDVRAAVAMATSKMRQINGYIAAFIEPFNAIAAEIAAIERGIESLLLAPEMLKSALASIVANLNSVGALFGGNSGSSSNNGGGSSAAIRLPSSATMSTSHTIDRMVLSGWLGAALTIDTSSSTESASTDDAGSAITITTSSDATSSGETISAADSTSTDAEAIMRVFLGEQMALAAAELASKADVLRTPSDAAVTGEVVLAQLQELAQISGDYRSYANLSEAAIKTEQALLNLPIQSAEKRAFNRDLPAIVCLVNGGTELGNIGDFIERNGIANPLAVPAGKELVYA